jgi:hypothetical protein
MLRLFSGRSDAKQLTPLARLVWTELVLKLYAGEDTVEVFYCDLAERVGVATRSIERSVAELLTAGFLFRLKRGTGWDKRRGEPSKFKRQPTMFKVIPEPGKMTETPLLTNTTNLSGRSDEMVKYPPNWKPAPWPAF